VFSKLESAQWLASFESAQCLASFESAQCLASLESAQWLASYESAQCLVSFESGQSRRRGRPRIMIDGTQPLCFAPRVYTKTLELQFSDWTDIAFSWLSRGPCLVDPSKPRKETLRAFRTRENDPRNSGSHRHLTRSTSPEPMQCTAGSRWLQEYTRGTSRLTNRVPCSLPRHFQTSRKHVMHALCFWLALASRFGRAFSRHPREVNQLLNFAQVFFPDWSLFYLADNQVVHSFTTTYIGRPRPSNTDNDRAESDVILSQMSRGGPNIQQRNFGGAILLNDSYAL
jgi:hypothetical protein